MAPETMKLNVGISSNGDVDVGEVSLADMDPEDIRVRNHCRKQLALTALTCRTSALALRDLANFG